MIVPKLTGKELEELLLWRARQHDELAGRYCMGRYGVMATLRDGQWAPIKSLPDFEGVLSGGRQFIFDAKASSQPSYDLSGGTHKSFKHQYKHMQRRARFGVICFVLLHFNERILKTRTDPPFTTLFPIEDNAFWQAYDAGEQKKISREEAKLYGMEVEWNAPAGRKESPDLYKALLKLTRERK